MDRARPQNVSRAYGARSKVTAGGRIAKRAGYRLVVSLRSREIKSRRDARSKFLDFIN